MKAYLCWLHSHFADKCAVKSCFGTYDLKDASSCLKHGGFNKKCAVCGGDAIWSPLTAKLCSAHHGLFCIYCTNGF